MNAAGPQHTVQLRQRPRQIIAPLDRQITEYNVYRSRHQRQLFDIAHHVGPRRPLLSGIAQHGGREVEGYHLIALRLPTPAEPPGAAARIEKPPSCDRPYQVVKPIAAGALKGSVAVVMRRG